MDAQNLVLEKFKELTECPVCTFEMHCPKLLPCYHTICLTCLERINETASIREGGQRKVSCPLCREKCAVPFDGFLNLSENYLVKQLLEARKYVDNYLLNAMCSIHAETEVKIFCLDCKKFVCLKCLETHRSHSLSEIEKALEQMNKERTIEILKIDRLISLIDSHLESMEAWLEEFDKNFEFIEEKIVLIMDDMYYKLGNETRPSTSSLKVKTLLEVDDRCSPSSNKHSDINYATVDQFSSVISRIATDSASGFDRKYALIEVLRQLAETHGQDLFDQLDYYRAYKGNEFESAKKELKTQKIILDSLKSFAEESQNLLFPATIQHSIDYIKYTLAGFSLDIKPDLWKQQHISFLPTEPRLLEENIDGSNNIIGKISVPYLPINYETRPTLVGWISTSNKIRGVCLSGQRIYLVFRETSEIAVHNVDATFSYYKSIPVEKMTDPSDIAASSNCLFVCEYGSQIIHRVQLAGQTSSITSWPVIHKCVSLSITKQGNVLVTCWEASELAEYTPIGSLIRQIELEPRLRYPLHAIKLDGDRYLICHANTSHRVGLVDCSGQLVKSFDKDKAYRGFPYYLSVDCNGFILVVERYLEKVRVLNGNLKHVTDFIPRSVDIKYPTRISLDQENGKLLLACDKQLLIFKIS